MRERRPTGTTVKEEGKTKKKRRKSPKHSFKFYLISCRKDNLYFFICCFEFIRRYGRKTPNEITKSSYTSLL
jgi:hypothetical protein